MGYTIRSINNDEVPNLDRFLYLAIFVPEGETPPPYSIIEKPELQVYVESLGKKKDDHIILAEEEGKIVGAAWARIMNDYGHLDDETPSIIISVEKEYRGKGIGKTMLSSLISILKNTGYKSVSLSVQKENYWLKTYKQFGFFVEKEEGSEYIMRKLLL